MNNLHEINRGLYLSSEGTIFNELRADCSKCFGFCCTALCFSASEGFPVDKDAGMSCPNLQTDFSCRVHHRLKELGLKGCLSYDCFGAGQRVAQVTYGGHDWNKIPESAEEMYKAFLVMRQLHEMLWYLAEALALKPAFSIHGELGSLFDTLKKLTFLCPDSLIKLDMAAHRADANRLLLKTSELVRSHISSGQKSSLKHKKFLGRGLDLMGADLRGACLVGEDLRGAYLIAASLNGADLSGADLIGADLRDADLGGANLAECIFLTQAQINSAKGDSAVRLPAYLVRPFHW